MHPLRGVIFAYSRNFCSADWVAAGLAVRAVDVVCVGKADD